MFQPRIITKYRGVDNGNGRAVITERIHLTKLQTYSHSYFNITD